MAAAETEHPRSNLPLPRRLAVVAAVLLSSIACDRATKELAEDALVNAGRISLLRDSVRVEYVENRGAFLSLGAALPDPLRTLLLTGGVAVVVAAVLAAAVAGRHRTWSQTAALALVASGGLGNLWDRLARDGRVVDFMNLGIGPVRTGVFNVADLAIVAGAVLLVLGSLRQVRRAPAEPPPAP